MARKKPVAGEPVDGLGWPLLSFEEREFLVERGYDVRETVGSRNPVEIAARPAEHPDLRMYNKARYELDKLLAPWGGDPTWRRSRNEAPYA